MLDTLLSLILTRLDQVDAPLILHREAEVYPAEQLSVMLSSGIIKETSRATEVRGLVVRETARGLVGVAEDDDFYQPVSLAEEDVRQYEVVASRLIDRLRRENELEGTPVQHGRRLMLIGERLLPGKQRADVYLSLVNDSESEFMSVCGRVRPTDSRPAVILVPTSVPLSVENRQLLSSRGVFVEPLRTHLNDRRWKLPWDRILKRPADSEKKERSMQEFYCLAVTRDGTQPLTKIQYNRLVAERDKYGMFIDGVTREASCREGIGRPRRSTLTPREFGVLADYMQAGKRMLPRSTKTGNSCNSVASAYRLFEEARRKADVKRGRYAYRAFRLHKDPTDAQLKSYEFAPPADLKYCLILPA